jgi:hypothetical protein
MTADSAKNLALWESWREVNPHLPPATKVLGAELELRPEAGRPILVIRTPIDLPDPATVKRTTWSAMLVELAELHANQAVDCREAWGEPIADCTCALGDAYRALRRRAAE